MGCLYSISLSLHPDVLTSDRYLNNEYVKRLLDLTSVTGYRIAEFETFNMFQTKG